MAKTKKEGKEEKPKDLDALLQKYEALHTREKQKELSDLTTRIDKAIVRAIDDFLIMEHGKDENGIPLHYHLGDPDDEYSTYKKADELIHHIGLSTLNYLFPGTEEEKMKVLKEVIGKDKETVLGILRTHGFDVNEFKNELMKYKRNIFKSENLKQFISHMAERIATKELRSLSGDIFNPYNVEKLRPYAQKKFEEKGFGIKAEGMTYDKLAHHLVNLYLGKINDEYVEEYKKEVHKAGAEKKQN